MFYAYFLPYRTSSDRTIEPTAPYTGQEVHRRWMIYTSKPLSQTPSCRRERMLVSGQRYIEITHDPLPFSVAQGIFLLSPARLLRSTLKLIEGGEGSLHFPTLLAVPRCLNNCYIMQILPLLFRQGSKLLIETVECTSNKDFPYR